MSRRVGERGELLGCEDPVLAYVECGLVSSVQCLVSSVYCLVPTSV